MSGPDQTNATNYLPMRLSNGSSFYNAVGGGGTGGPPYSMTARGYQQITAGTLAAATALTIPSNATFALLQAENGDLRWRDDGTAPTGSVGMILYSGTTIELAGDLSTIKFIELTSQSGILNVSYYS